MTRFSDKIIFSHTTYLRLAQQWSWFANYLRIFAMSEKNLNVWLTTSKKKRWYPIYPEIPGNTQEYPEIPESKKDTRKYPIIYFNTPTRPEPDPLPGIFSNTRPDPILKNPTRWALVGNTSSFKMTQQMAYRSLQFLQFWPNLITHQIPKDRQNHKNR